VTAVVLIVRVGTVGLLVAGLVVAVVTGRWRVLLTVVVGGAVAAALFGLVDLRLDVEEAALTKLSDFAGPLTSTSFPTSVGLAIAAAVTTAAGPWLPRRYRRIGWVLVFGLGATRFITAPVSGRAAAAVLCGWVGGSLALVILGGPVRRPGKDAVIDGLNSVGVGIATLEAAAVDARGSTPYFGATTDGRKLFVKVLADDERKADLLFRLYRYVVPRHLGDERPFSSLRRAVEHEGFMALSAGQVGVRTPRFLGVARADPSGFVLAYEAIDGKSFDKVPDDELTDGVLGQVWEQVGILRVHRMAHRDLRLANLFLDRQGVVSLIDFGFSELAVSDLLLATDLAELVSSLSTRVGPERAVAGAEPVVGPDGLRTALPRLRLGFLSGATRTALKERPEVLDEVKRAVSGEPRPATDTAPVA
jgi:undecaprenyl-diphosphatase